MSRFDDIIFKALMVFMVLMVIGLLVFMVLGLTGVITITHDPNYKPSPVLICNKIGNMQICNQV
jgi:hypothetical protein